MSSTLSGWPFSSNIRMASSLERTSRSTGTLRPGQLFHALFDGLEVLGREGGVPQEIVIVTGLDGRADAGLGLGIEIEDGVGQEVRGAVPQHIDRNIGFFAHSRVNQ